jgi:5-deoxy-glucuronate isomerase
VSIHRPWGSLAGPDPHPSVPLVLTPQDAGWERAGLRVVRLAAGEVLALATGDAEAFVLPLAGSLTVDVEPVEADDVRPAARFGLQGRVSVFTRVTDFAYAGRDSLVTLTSSGGAEVALPSARCERRLPARYGPAQDVPVEVRGAGGATRQVTDLGTPGAWDHADRLVCCEVLTPPGNWSSHPPHKHDVTDPCPVVNEEIYFYRIAGPDQVTPSRQGFGLHRTYTGPEHAAAGLAPLEETLEVRDGDVVLVPYGYHGPCAAAPGYPMYYLNVLAGPGDQRSTAFCDDPQHAWVRAGRDGVEADARCPLTSATERTDR